MKKTKIDITVKNTGIGLKVFDYLNAAEITISDKKIQCTINQPTAADLRVLFVPMNSKLSVEERDCHDLIFFSNNDEPLTVLDSNITKWIRLPKSYLICNSYTHHSHQYHPKIIWANNDGLITRQYWTNAIFPVYHDHVRSKHLPKNKDLTFINGQNRSWRHHYITLLQQQIPSLPIVSNFSEFIYETNDAQWESSHDTEFREYVNSQYLISRNKATDYYPPSQVR